MKHSLRQGGGYLSIDHRDSPGISAQDAACVPGAVAVPGGKHYETDTYQCTHCQRGVVRFDASGRAIDPPVCLKCNHYICEGCNVMYRVTGECVPFKAVLDRADDIQAKFAGQPDHPDARVDVSDLQKPGAPRVVLTDAL